MTRKAKTTPVTGSGDLMPGPRPLIVGDQAPNPARQPTEAMLAVRETVMGGSSPDGSLAAREPVLGPSGALAGPRPGAALMTGSDPAMVIMPGHAGLDHEGGGGLAHGKPRPVITGAADSVMGAPMTPPAGRPLPKAGTVTPKAMKSDKRAE